MKNLTWQNPEQLFVAQELINKVKSKCCGIKVYVDWFVDNGKLDAHLIFDCPLEHKGNEVGKKLKDILKELKIKKFDDLKGVLSPNVKCYPKE